MNAQEIAAALNTLRRFQNEYEHGMFENTSGYWVDLQEVAEVLGCRMSLFVDDAPYDTVIPKVEEQ